MKRQVDVPKNGNICHKKQKACSITCKPLGSSLQCPVPATCD
jgi:hypothetical protein